MKIDRQTYESFFLLYVDNELEAAQRQAVEDFVRENLDLAEELRMLQAATAAPDPSVIYFDKKSLLKTGAVTFMTPLPNGKQIDEDNYEEYFLLYCDHELSGEERTAVEKFAELNDQFKKELEAFKSVVVQPEAEVRFEEISSLYRHEEIRRIIPFRRYAIAAAVTGLLLLGIATYFSFRSENSVTPPVAVNPGKGAGTKNIIPAPVSEDATAISPAVADRNKPETSSSTRPDRSPGLIDPAGDRSLAEHSGDVKHTVPQTRTAASQRGPERSAETRKADLVKTSGSPRKSPAESRTLPATSEEQNHPETVSGLPPVSGNDLRSAVVKTIGPEPGKAQSPAASFSGNAAARSADAQPVEDYVQTDDSHAGLTEEENSEKGNFNFASTSISNKNRFRGLFRKASRYIEKAAHIEPSSSERGIRIASFEIALQ